MPNKDTRMTIAIEKRLRAHKTIIWLVLIKPRNLVPMVQSRKVFYLLPWETVTFRIISFGTQPTPESSEVPSFFFCTTLPPWVFPRVLGEMTWGGVELTTTNLSKNISFSLRLIVQTHYKHRHTCSFAYFLEYFLLFLDDNVNEECE